MTCLVFATSTTSSTLPITRPLESAMNFSWDSETAWPAPELDNTEQRGRHMSTVALPGTQSSSTMIIHLSPPEIEEEILRDPELQEHHAAVLLYLRLDIWSLESICALRSRGPPELAQLHPTLFTSPPESLFKLIYTIRHFTGLNLAGTISRIEAASFPGRQKEVSREPAGKIAPRGQAYACPSKHCKKVFIKSGHAANHVEKNHPEYLKLHPDYQPSQVMVEHLRSRPNSPEMERQDKQRSSHKQAELRPSAVTPGTPSVASEGLSIYFSDGASGSWDRPSPRLQGYESQGDSDEAPRLIPSRNASRNTNRPSPFHPITPQEPYGQPSPDLSRYHTLVGCSKRGREHSLSVGSVTTVDQDEEDGTTRFRHHAKRRSTMGSSEQYVPC